MQLCAHGHPWIEDNLYTYPDGRKGCRTCRREWHENNHDYLISTFSAKENKCARGHLAVPGNMYTTRKGTVKCRVCRDNIRWYRAMV
jgi:hypothetical protein